MPLSRRGSDPLTAETLQVPASEGLPLATRPGIRTVHAAAGPCTVRPNISGLTPAQAAGLAAHPLELAMTHRQLSYRARQ